MRPLIRCAVLWLLALGLHAEAAAKWTQLQSENFLFIGNASEGQIRRLAERLEQFRDAMLRVLPNANAHSPVPTVVMVFDTDRSMTPVKPLFRGKPIEVAGYFQSDEDVNYILVNAEYLELEVTNIFHEYAHFLINNTLGRVPVWVGEGLAELYAMTKQLDGGKSVVIGSAPGEHIALLRSSTMMPIKELVAVDQSASVYNEGNRRTVLYAQSWALVHYLTLGNPTRAVQFRNYLAAMQSGTTHEEAFAAAFDDAALLDRELSEYVRRLTFPALRIGFREKSSATSVPRGKTLDDDEADAYLADIQARVSRVDEARKRVAAIQKRAPQVGRAFMVLGAIDLRANRLSDAVAHLEKAAALAPDDFIVQSTYGRSLVMRMSEVRNYPDVAAKILPQARRALVRATTINPGSARAAWMLAYVELAGGGDVSAAVGALTRAIQLDPRREEYRILLAQALVRQGEYEKATALLGPLMASGRTTEVRTEARRVLSDLANMRAARATGAAPPITTAVTASIDTSTPVPPGVSTASAVDAARLAEIRREGDRTSGLLLRVVQPGEQRVLGTLDAIDCVNGTIVIRVTSNGRTLALKARQFAEVDFISYRSSTPGKVNCGPQQSRDRVYATYRPDAAGGSIDGLAVAIEVLPDDFVPPNPPR